MSQDLHRYDDIIHLPHPVSRRHPQMALADRAAQFSPFAALTGYDAAIRETARLTDEKVELNEDAKASLNEKLMNLGEQEAAITYFVPDEKKTGGAYCTVRGRVKQINEYEKTLIMADGLTIAFEQVCEIESIAGEQ